ncbi:GNAT family N-acetyltransferase [Neobacillus sp. WH10]|uniref:GNAT family N-acetyltransferase n=1 Tax=Neobacillus sp. WH10 TaxID=3047873 RepID=UPI0024C10F9C|nr:GNAT family N-acetyltransferase [Neobacillus sp. WH10]WHY75166.1 GNAT family N-acetyltransferase [Neobacillus sp. WH10]
MLIQKVTINELDSLTELFNLYRVFYNQKSDVNSARKFLTERILKEESVVFIALNGHESLGFVQLYPSFSSVSMQRSWVLNDLFVKETARGQGVGEKLMKTAIEFAKETGAKGVLLETAKDNTTAQRLYEKIGFIREGNYYYYFSN